MPSISRRDFLNGVALTVAAGLTPAAQIAAEPLRYPPALTGLRGQHAGSFETAHAQAREGKRFALDRLPVEEHYDLVVVGAGISGLAGAAFYRRAAGPSARILVLDNHDDFGGHAKRNEFTLDGRLVIGYGGSESIDSPKTRYSDVAKGLLRDLGVEVERFETAFDRTLYASLGLSRGVFFAREAFGRDVLVAGEPSGGRTDESSPSSRQRQAARRVRGRVSDLVGEQGTVARALRWYARSARRQDCRGEVGNPQADELPRLPHWPLRLQRRGRELLPGPHARLLRARMRRGGRRRRPRARLSGLRRPGLAGAGPRARALYLSLPRRQRLARSSPGALAHSRHRARPQHGRRGARGVRLRQARSRRPRRAHPPRFDLCRRPQRRRQRAHRLRARGSAASRRGQARRARLLPHGHSAHHAGPAGVPARGARAQRQDAARLYQRAHARLAPVGAARRAQHLRADVVSQPSEARFSRQSRRLSPRPRPGRTDLPPSRSRSRRAQPRARRARAVSHRAGAAARHDV